MVLSLAAFNAWGVVQGVTRYTWLTELPLSLPPAYLVGRSLVWAVAFAALAVGLWRLREWARVGTLAGFTLYLAQGWAERLLFGQTGYLRQTMPFFAVLHLAALAVVWGVLLRRTVRRSFSA